MRPGYQRGVISKNENSHIKRAQRRAWLIQKPTFLSLTWLVLSKAMPLVSGIYIIEFGLEYSAGTNSAPTPDPLYLTRNRDGQQLTVEHGNPIGSLNKQVDLYNKCCHINLSAIAVEHPVTVRGRKFQIIGRPYNNTSALRTKWGPSSLPGYR